MIKEYVASFGYLSIAVMILFFTLFWFLVYQTLKIGRSQSEKYSRLPIEEKNDSSVILQNGRNSNG